jgi:hypothetical protein
VRGLLLALVLLSGCMATEITDLSNNLTEKDIAKYGGSSVDHLKRYFFTDEAYEAIKDIPIKESSWVRGYAGGTTFLSTVIDVFTLNGPGRQVLLSPKMLDKKNHVELHILHELIHHLDDMGRDGEKEFINLKEFDRAYRTMYGHYKFHGLLAWTERHANHWWTDLFGIGEYSEHIAYSGSKIAFQGTTIAMRKAFSRILRHGNKNDGP